MCAGRVCDVQGAGRGRGQGWWATPREPSSPARGRVDLDLIGPVCCAVAAGSGIWALVGGVKAH